MKRNIKLFLEDIIIACKDIQDFTEGMELNHFIQDKKTSSAVIRQFEIIGEAAKNVPESIRIKYSVIPWKDISGMRDRLIHGYFGVDYYLVWDTIKTDVPELIDNIQQIICDLKEEGK
ncbi:MAG: DUF86 domain-containing protein [bacterium]|nr:DUF86 domain-containing protein [bacterium]